MPRGRCAGCGRHGSPTQVCVHILGCAEYLRLYRESPERCLDPEAEYERHNAAQNTPEARAERRGARLTLRFAETDRQQIRDAARWQQPGDLFDD